MNSYDKKRFCDDINSCNQSLPVAFKDAIKAKINDHPTIKEALQENYLERDDIDAWFNRLSLVLFPMIEIDCNIIRFYQEKLTTEMLTTHSTSSSDHDGFILSSTLMNNFKQDFIRSQVAIKNQDNETKNESWEYYSRKIEERFKQPFFADYFIKHVKEEPRISIPTTVPTNPIALMDDVEPVRSSSIMVSMCDDNISRGPGMR